MENDFDQMILIGGPIYVGVPRDASLEFKRHILAAVKTYRLGNKSIDYVLRRYGHSWAFDEPTEEEKFIDENLRCIRYELKKLYKTFDNGKKRIEHVGLFAAEMALLRIQASCRCASILLGQHYYYEAATICRLILEQMAWAFQVSTKDTKEEIIKTNPTKSINNLKKIVPYVGELYGRLSTIAHLEPEFNGQYLDFENGPKVVMLRLLNESQIILYYYALLIDCLAIVIEIVSYDYIELHKCVEITDGKLRLKPVRPLTALIEILESKVCSKDVS